MGARQAEPTKKPCLSTVLAADAGRLFIARGVKFIAPLAHPESVRVCTWIIHLAGIRVNQKMAEQRSYISPLILRIDSIPSVARRAGILASNVKT